MEIKFIVTSMKDQTLLCEEKKEEAFVEVPFNEIDRNTIKDDKAEEYCNTVMNDLKLTLRGMIFHNEGIINRIARRVYKTQIGDCLFNVAFVIDTGADKKSSVTVEILAENIVEMDIENQYVRDIELFKLTLKNRMLNDFDHCTWLVDDQSQLLCSQLYPRIFQIENLVRAFSNEVLVAHLGQDWLDQHGLEKYKKSVQSMGESFKQIVPDFRNINSVFLSMTLETLTEIIFKAVVYESSITLTLTDIDRLNKVLSCQQHENAKKYIQSKKVVKVCIWSDLFIQYLNDPENFKNMFLQFIKNRNHVAHNKLLTFSVYKQIQSEFDNFKFLIEDAMQEFENKNASEELMQTWMIENEQEEEQYDVEYREEYLRNRVFEETGVQIRGLEEIYEMFCQTIEQLNENISNRYHFDSCFTVERDDILADDGDTNVCTIVSNASEDELLIQASVDIDESMDTMSYLKIKAMHNGEIIAVADCTYHNGRGHEGDEGDCVADIISEYDEAELDDFFEVIYEYIECELNPYVSKLKSLMFVATKNKEPKPVADFSCEECGKYGVSVLEDFFPIGKCCFCGTENEKTNDI